MKKKLLFLVAAFALFVPSVMAATKDVSTSEELKNAISDAASGDTIKLTADITDDSLADFAYSVKDNKELTVDMNGHNITVKPNNNYPVFSVYRGGKLSIIGEGTITSTNTSTSFAIAIYGNDTDDTSKVNKVNIGKNVTIKAYDGIIIQPLSNNAYNVVVDFAGKIYATSMGIYIQGVVKNNNAPVINIKDGAVIEANEVAIYAAGNGTWTIGEAKITGVECGLGIKSGVFNIDGATVKATGEDATPTAGYGNGINPSGAAIQIEANNAYTGKIELNIKSGTFTSEKGIAVYEYLDTNSSTPATDTAVKTITIKGGKFNSAENKPVMALSDEFVEKHTATEFIDGGTFKSGDKDTIVGTLDGEFLPVEVTVKLTAYLYVDGVKTEEDVTYVKKGTALGEGFETLFKGFIEGEGYVYNGTFTDEKLKNKFDYKAELEEDSVMYVSTSTVKEKEPEEEKKNETPKTDVKEETKKEENPDTGDLNLELIIGTIIVGTLGVFVASKKISAKVTR